jgi:hypothetical protein
MAVICSGEVFELHYAEPATSPDVIDRTPLAEWARGSESGIHYYTHGAIVAPAADVEAAFR